MERGSDGHGADTARRAEPDTDGGGTRRWSSRSIGTPLQHRIFYTLIRLGGRRAAYGLLVFVSLHYALFRPSVRGRSRHYLSRRFPGRSRAGRLWDRYRIILELGKILVDRAVLGILGPDSLTVSLSGREALLALLEEGRGLILATAHVGCWQVGMASLKKLGAPVNLLIHRDEGDVDRHFFEHGRGGSPFRVIDPAGPLGGTLEMLQALKRGEVLCIMGDRVMGDDRNTTTADFLGGRVQLPYSPYKLASATGAPVAVVFPYKSGPDSYALRVAQVIRVPADRGRAAEAYRPYAAQFIRALEDFVDEYPYQFFNFFNMWEEAKDTAP